MNTHAASLQGLSECRTVLLTTYKRDGSAVGTPVNIAVEGDHGYFRTYEKAWKAKRLRRNPHATLAPSTRRGESTGPAVKVTARLLDGAEAQHAGALLKRKYRLLQGVMVPLAHVVMRQKNLDYEVRPEE